MRAGFLHGIRPRLMLVALVLLVLPWLAAQFISGMEISLRAAQEQSIGASARAVAAALSDRPALFDRGKPAPDPEDEERRRIVALFAAADTQAAASLGAAYTPSEEIERLLSIMGRRGARLWVIDTRSRVRGLSGSLGDAPPPPGGWLRFVAALVVPTPRSAVGDESKPVRAQIDRALIGVSGEPLWRGTVNRDVAILSAAQPIFVGDDIVGAVVVEETTGSIQILKQSALEKLLAVTLAVVGGALVILLAFASRLTTRIRRLHAEAEGAIDSQGRVRGPIAASQARDEIGDLSRTMSAVLERLRHYNAYLEAMAGRLSHELRTPVAVVRSSLDNLKAQPLTEEARVYVDRAGEGVGRLARLISRLSEGTRLERMLETAERERFDLAAVVAGCVEGYRSAYAPREFVLDCPGRPRARVSIEACPMPSPRCSTSSPRTRTTSRPRARRSACRSSRGAAAPSSRWRMPGRRCPRPRAPACSIRWCRCARPRRRARARTWASASISCASWPNTTAGRCAPWTFRGGAGCDSKSICRKLGTPEIAGETRTWPASCCC